MQASSNIQHIADYDPQPPSIGKQSVIAGKHKILHSRHGHAFSQLLQKMLQCMITPIPGPVLLVLSNTS